MELLAGPRDECGNTGLCGCVYLQNKIEKIIFESSRILSVLQNIFGKMGGLHLILLYIINITVV